MMSSVDSPTVLKHPAGKPVWKVACKQVRRLFKSAPSLTRRAKHGECVQ